jgi:hypothetical protein
MIGKLTVLVLALAIGSAQADSMKGWEIYSWPDVACSATPQVHSAINPDSVCFALLPGTNRLKTAPEIKKTPLKLADIKQKLASLKRGEEVFWTVGDVTTSNQFDEPSASPVDARRRVVQEIDRLGLKLTIVPPPPNVGTITMFADRSIELRLRSLPPGPIAETLVRYKPGDAKYKESIDHVGGLAPGETKMLPPWP